MYKLGLFLAFLRPIKGKTWATTYNGYIGDYDVFKSTIENPSKVSLTYSDTGNFLSAWWNFDLSNINYPVDNEIRPNNISMLPLIAF